MSANAEQRCRAASMLGPAIACAAVFAVLKIGIGELSLAQSDSLRERLTSASRIECRFPVLSTGTWEGSGTTATTAPAELEASYSDVDVVSGTAQAVSRYGSSYIAVRYTGDYLSLIQISDIGPLYITTVIAAETTDGRLKAVHTRHEFAASSYPDFRKRPEMYIGECTLGN